MKSNQNDEADRRWEEAKRKFREGVYAHWRSRPRMVAINVNTTMAKAIEFNPESLVVRAVDRDRSCCG